MAILSEPGKILITGATHGIGKAAAELFCSRGWEVYGISGNGEDGRGAAMEKTLPGFHYRVADVSNEPEISALLGRIGQLDAAFNNAGTGIAPQKLSEADIARARRVIDVNLVGTLICMKHEIAHMPGSGVVVNNASLAAFKAATGADMSYSASKAGVLALTAEAAANPEFAGRVSFFSIAPGYIETRMTAADDKEAQKRRLPSRRLGQPAEVAALIYNIITNHYAFTSGQCFNFDGGAFLI